MTDGTTSLNEANMNKALMSDGTKIQVKVYHAHIRYNGASWEVVAADDSAGIVTGDLAWSTNHLNITLSGFTNPPIAVVSPNSTGTTAALIPAVDVTSNVQMQVYFFDYAGTVDTTQATDMDFTIILMGF
jgi:hypothetical protein